MLCLPLSREQYCCDRWGWHISLLEQMKQADARKPKGSLFLCIHGHRSLPYNTYLLYIDLVVKCNAFVIGGLAYA